MALVHEDITKFVEDLHTFIAVKDGKVWFDDKVNNLLTEMNNRVHFQAFVHSEDSKFITMLRENGKEAIIIHPLKNGEITTEPNASFVKFKARLFKKFKTEKLILDKFIANRFKEYLPTPIPEEIPDTGRNKFIITDILDHLTKNITFEEKSEFLPEEFLPEDYEDYKEYIMDVLFKGEVPYIYWSIKRVNDILSEIDPNHGFQLIPLTVGKRIPLLTVVNRAANRVIAAIYMTKEEAKIQWFTVEKNLEELLGFI